MNKSRLLVLFILTLLSHGVFSKEDYAPTVREHLLPAYQVPGVSLDVSKDETKGTLGASYGINRFNVEAKITGTLKEDSGTFFTKDGGLSTDSSAELNFSYMHLDKVPKDISEEEILIDHLEKEYNACLDKNLGDETKCKVEEEALEKAVEWEDLPYKYYELKSFWIGNFKLKVSDTEFTYFSIEESKSISQSEDGYELELYGAFVSTEKKDRIQFGVSYSEGFAFSSKNKPRNICFDNSTLNALECINHPLEAPLQTKILRPYVSYTKNLKGWGLGVVKGASVKISQIETKQEAQEGAEVDSSKWGVEVPIYLFLSNKGDYTGAFQLNWLSEVPDGEDRLTVSLIFSKPFDVFGK